MLTQMKVIKHMKSTVFKLVFFWFLIMSSLTYGVTDEEVANRLDTPIKELDKKLNMVTMSNIPPLSSPYLVGLTDAEKIRGMLVWMKRIQGREQHYGIGHVSRLIRNDPNIIKDTSELRKLLLTTDELNSFYLLARLSDSFLIRGEQFIVEKSRMLLRHGRVAFQVSDDTYSSTLDDVSSFTYKSIYSNLSYFKAPFDEATMMPHQGMIPTDQKIEILVKWLRENWPGCEKLGLEDSVKQATGNEKSDSTSSITQPAKHTPLPTKKQSAEATSPNFGIWIGMGLVSLFAVCLGAFFYNRRRARS
jgi:hypothetical protein